MPTRLTNLKSLCERNSDGIYQSKKGQEYIDALSSLYDLNNRNDKPFTVEDVKNQPLLEEFDFEGVNEFKYICKLNVRPMEIRDDRRKNEKIFPEDFDDDNAEDIFMNSSGVAYILTALADGDEHIVKIGQTRTPFKKRLQSYNCGCVSNWRTASTTNIKILQSMVTTRLTFKLYLCDCSHDPYQITWCGVKSQPFASPKSLAVEDIMIHQFIQKFGMKPLANIQANPT